MKAPTEKLRRIKGTSTAHIVIKQGEITTLPNIRYLHGVKQLSKCVTSCKPIKGQIPIMSV